MRWQPGLVRAVALSTAAGALLIVLFRTIVIIPSGYVGVVDNFGQVQAQTLKPGIKLVNPLVQVVKLSTRTKEIKETLDTPSQEGLNLNIDVSILYHLDPQKAQQVYETIGTNYEDVILIPQFRAVIRQITASYDTKALYTSQRQQISQQIREQLSQRVASRGIVVEDTPLRRLDLPDNFRKSVEQKLRTEQEAQQMDFILKKENTEAERKRIEAKGIADSQKIISEGLNDKILQLRRIEATEKLAASQNAKVVVVGGGTSGSPVSIQP